MNLKYNCPTCNMEALNIRAADHILEPPKVDDIYLCGGCGSVCKVSLTGLVLMLSEEFDGLDEQTRADLNFATRAIKRQVRQS